jgi:hypothetical protein
VPTSNDRKESSHKSSVQAGGTGLTFQSESLNRATTASAAPVPYMNQLGSVHSITIVSPNYSTAWLRSRMCLYSYLRTLFGSVSAAFSAEPKHARRAVEASARATKANVGGSSGFTPYSRLAMTLEKVTATIPPTRRAANTTRMACHSTSHIMSRVFAPRRYGDRFRRYAGLRNRS